MIIMVQSIAEIQDHGKHPNLKQQDQKGGDVQKGDFQAILQQALNSTNERK